MKFVEEINIYMGRGKNGYDSKGRFRFFFKTLSRPCDCRWIVLIVIIHSVRGVIEVSTIMFSFWMANFLIDFFRWFLISLKNYTLKTISNVKTEFSNLNNLPVQYIRNKHMYSTEQYLLTGNTKLTTPPGLKILRKVPAYAGVEVERIIIFRYRVY